MRGSSFVKKQSGWDVLQFSAPNPAIEGMKPLVTRCLSIALVLLIAGCAGYWGKRPLDQPTPLNPRNPVWIWTRGGVEKWHEVVITPDSVSGIPQP